VVFNSVGSLTEMSNCESKMGCESCDRERDYINEIKGKRLPGDKF